MVAHRCRAVLMVWNSCCVAIGRVTRNDVNKHWRTSQRPISSNVKATQIGNFHNLFTVMDRSISSEKVRTMPVLSMAMPPLDFAKR